MKMFPIQDGPSVPWEVMAPHDAQSKLNHGGQDIQRIAERGGFSCAEAWLVVQGLPNNRATTPEGEMRTWYRDDCKRSWIQFAERVNLHYVELEQMVEARKQDILLMSKAEERILVLEAALRELVTGIENWNAAVKQIIQIPDHNWQGLELAKELLKKP
jgi:hypothetical protein